ncbi:hypothetical protein [Maribacter halichondriae]|uniref:hypothetical protein n=1 Tax=Maribacter halichondriae TaxID=2980554 RepID=UPI0023595D87|nr:hypothetical protein [Maribacter sp. Hal144]
MRIKKMMTTETMLSSLSPKQQRAIEKAYQLSESEIRFLMTFHQRYKRNSNSLITRLLQH